MVCSLSFSFELGSLRLVLFCGKDFAFNNTDVTSKTTTRAMHRHSEKVVARSTNPAGNPLGLANTMLGGGHSRFFGGLSRQQSQVVNRENISKSRVSRIGVKDDKEVMLLEDNYMEENELAEDRPEEYSRLRTEHRKHNMYAKLEI